MSGLMIDTTWHGWRPVSLPPLHPDNFGGGGLIWLPYENMTVENNYITSWVDEISGEVFAPIEGSSKSPVLAGGPTWWQVQHTIAEKGSNLCSTNKPFSPGATGWSIGWEMHVGSWVTGFLVGIVRAFTEGNVPVSAEGISCGNVDAINWEHHGSSRIYYMEDGWVGRNVDVMLHLVVEFGTYPKLYKNGQPWLTYFEIPSTNSNPFDFYMGTPIAHGLYTGMDTAMWNRPLTAQNVADHYAAFKAAWPGFGLP